MGNRTNSVISFVCIFVGVVIGQILFKVFDSEPVNQSALQRFNVQAELPENEGKIFVVGDNVAGKTFIVFSCTRGVVLLNTYDTPKDDDDSSRASTGLNQER